MSTVYVPLAGCNAHTHDIFVQVAPLSHYIFDRPIVNILGQAGGMRNNSLVSMGDNTPAIAEINTAEVGGFTVTGTDSVSFLWALPLDIDLAQAIDFRALWSDSSATAAGTGQIIFTYLPVVSGTTAIAVATSAMTTDGAAVADNAAANVPLWSAWSSLAGATLTGTPGDDLLIVKAASTLVTITDLTMYMFQIRYYRRYYSGGAQML